MNLARSPCAGASHSAYRAVAKPTARAPFSYLEFDFRNEGISRMSLTLISKIPLCGGSRLGVLLG